VHRLLLSWVVICLFSTLSANASSIPVFTATSATVFVSNGSDPTITGYVPQFTLSGEGFSYIGTATAGCNFCTSGFSVEPGTTMIVGLTSYSEGFDTLITGASFQSSLLSGGTLNILGGSFTLPTGNQSTFSITVLATLSGILNPCPFDINAFSCTSRPVATISVNLHGTGTLTYVRTNGTWSFSSATFTFSPVPEPGTLLLLGTGAAALVGAVRGRRPR
jgi:PEP-CTERM motif-containing protein